MIDMSLPAGPVPPSRVIAVARDWLGVRFHHQGRSRDGGVDCSGLVTVVARDLGATVPDQPPYPKWPSDALMHATLLTFFLPVDPNAVRVSDIVRMTLPHRPPCHIGIVSEMKGRRSLIHAHHARGVVETWHKGGDVVAAYRWPASVVTP